MWDFYCGAAGTAGVGRHMWQGIYFDRSPHYALFFPPSSEATYAAIRQSAALRAGAVVPSSTVPTATLGEPIVLILSVSPAVTLLQLRICQMPDKPAKGWKNPGGRGGITTSLPLPSRRHSPSWSWGRRTGLPKIRPANTLVSNRKKWGSEIQKQSFHSGQTSLQVGLPAAPL